ncbi:MAG TPA: DNA mismatch repair protein MutS, partial [Methylomirabilota bacterium]|nr:DNA mismatch repair protein MutS [Methylomirabilota bacterium]
MMRQYGELKRRFPDYLLLFRLGDFYELFNDDAHVASRLLQLTLTSRQNGVPMAGIPHHAADGYIARLIRAGQKVAVCEQLEEPAKGRKIVRRDVVRVITPGTITDTQYLDGARNNFLLAAHATGAAVGVALVDVSTGDFWVGEEPGTGEALLETALLRRPAEILLAQTAEPAWVARWAPPGVPVTRVDGGAFGARAAREVLEAHFRGASLDGLGMAALTAGLQAAGAALAYVRETQGESLAH